MRGLKFRWIHEANATPVTWKLKLTCYEN